MSFSALASTGRVWVVDGGLATELESRGYTIRDDPLWSARLLHTDPQAILEVHKIYLESGADILITASYQASVDGFCRELGVTQAEALSLIARSVTIAKQAQQQVPSRNGGKLQALIAGSVGPYGACQHDGSEYTGSYVEHMTKQELKAWHRPRVSELVLCGVDMLACETLPAQLEAEALVELLHDEFPTTQAWISFSCKCIAGMDGTGFLFSRSGIGFHISQHTAGNGTQTCHGEDFADAVAAVVRHDIGRKDEGRGEGSGQIVAVGVNCSDPNHIESLLRSASHVNDDRGFIVYPNSGEMWNPQHHLWTGSAVNVSREAEKWIQLGARFIGGCCRVGPDTIRTLRQTVDEHNKTLQLQDKTQQ